MEYIIDDQKYSFHYQDVKEHYNRFVKMSDRDFVGNIAEGLHLACLICFIKEIPTYLCLSDKGIIHELIHLVQFPDEPLDDLKETRNKFRKQLKLA